jgi:heterodisulfide reductase subunit A
VGLINLAVAKVVTGRTMETITTDIKPSCTIIGAGIAGISAATALAQRDIRVTLVEREDRLGGLLKRLNVIFPSYRPASEFVEDQTRQLSESGIEVVTGAEPLAVRGHVGSFEIELSKGRTLESGTIIVATGADLLRPEGLFGYGEKEEVVTQIELEDLLMRGENPGSDIVMIQCAGSRNAERPYCSRICCTASIKNTILIKQRYPAANITLLSRGFAEYAGDLDRARDMGVNIIRYSAERVPVVGDTTVEVYDEISDMEAHVPYDRVVLAVPMIPSESSRRTADMLRLQTDEYGFLVEPHLKIRPEEYAPRGIFVAGCAHWPTTMTEAIVQGYGAASRAFDLISQGRIAREAFVSHVDSELCRGCGRCEEVCRHGAIDLTVGEDGLKQAEVIAIQCTGCGVCVSVCPSGALSLDDMSSDQVAKTVEALEGV